MSIAGLLAVAMVLAGCAGAPKNPPLPPQAGDCATLRIWSNGFHTNLAVRAEHLPEAHPFRALFPDAAHFLIGWGERNFFMDPDPGFFDGLGAILPPSRSVIQVMAHDAPLEETLWRPKDLAEIAVSEEGMAALADALAAALTRGDDGAPIVLGEGRLAERSLFLAAEGGFHLFYMCNQWTAERLAEAGVPIKPARSFTAGGLLKAAKSRAPAQCPG